MNAINLQISFKNTSTGIQYGANNAGRTWVAPTPDTSTTFQFDMGGVPKGAYDVRITFTYRDSGGTVVNAVYAVSSVAVP